MAKVWWHSENNQTTIDLYCGHVLDVLRGMRDGSVQCVVTSPPYWGLRDYGIPGQYGLEPTPGLYVQHMVEVFREVQRVLRDDGTLWLNLGDSYAANRSYQVRDNKHIEVGNHMRSIVPGGYKPKDLIGIPWLTAFALQFDKWYLRSDIIWSKPNPMPESVTDRPTKAHEYLFLLAKSERYCYDANAIKEPGRNKRTVWEISTQPYPEAHFATFPEALVEPCILAGCPEGKIVLDPFSGSGTTLLVAQRLGRHSIGIDLSEQYCQLAKKRLEPAHSQYRLL